MCTKKNGLVISKDEVVATLSSILSSPNFRRSPKLTALLTFLVERKLSKQEEDLKEQVIGQRVFNLSEGFNPRENPIVRVNISRLRSLLRGYNDAHPDAHHMQIRLPDMGYVPVFECLRPVVDGVDEESNTSPSQHTSEERSPIELLNEPLNSEDITQIRGVLEDCLKDQGPSLNRYTLAAILLGCFASMLSLLLLAHETGLVFAGDWHTQVVAVTPGAVEVVQLPPQLAKELRQLEGEIGGKVSCRIHSEDHIHVE
ncbi:MULTISPECIES: hypothetical protein [unclassified Pseudovibrio]|uniref:hypothetical protein n=1 Tax=unclassified Pseudovibrio TaxID=2627060 RepID=UPI0007AE80DF|nr:MULTISPECIES: hypothetical protein [unclassified Pseudovibrio]KZL26510.1 hypothetical protein PsWM33_01355 [Pseudovibrio sp. WM33]KZL27171.1 hypothetical protein PsAD37_01308 [Pseudovibrio sp. Ad37]